MCVEDLEIIEVRRELDWVDVWFVTLTDAHATPESMLTKEEDRAQYKKIIPLRKKQNFLFRRISLDFVLKQYVGDYTLGKNLNGKPFLLITSRMRKIHFSASSSSNICAIGISLKKIGIDVENRITNVDMVGLCERFLPDFLIAKKGLVDSLLIEDIAIHEWCRVESFVKLYGNNLHKVLIKKNKIDSDLVKKLPNFNIVISNENYVCSISQKKPFRINKIHKIKFEDIHGGYQ